MLSETICGGGVSCVGPSRATEQRGARKTRRQIQIYRARSSADRILGLKNRANAQVAIAW